MAVDVETNALRAMCRQVVGLRLALIALGTPYALLGAGGEGGAGLAGLAAPGRAAPGGAVWPVGTAVLVTFLTSYALFRNWERLGGPLLLRHPTLLAADALVGSLLLVTAGPDSVLGYVGVCTTPLLAGLAYGPRGAASFACLQSLIVVTVYAAGLGGSGLGAPGMGAPGLGASVLLAGLSVIAGGLGVTLRNLLSRYGAAARALAVAQAAQEERAHLARDLHDSVAKTLHGLALQADALAESPDPRGQARAVAGAARRAVEESRELLAGLRGVPYGGVKVDLTSELTDRVRDFARRSGIRTCYVDEGAAPPAVPSAVAGQLLTIASEALENAGRHARPTRVDVSAGVVEGLLRISVRDDGRGLPPGTTLDGLRRTGHFGLVGMVERAAGVGARIRIGRGCGGLARGTEVRLELPVEGVAAR
ncbi:histidine kinase [Streptomyces sp. NPDC050848]|uniref:sensor histidine kinase n=1 Tax=Streptomyces sp. NPDC050848 TaxID=3155791 RepID=UPI0033F6DC80